MTVSGVHVKDVICTFDAAAVIPTEAVFVTEFPVAATTAVCAGAVAMETS